MHEADIERVTGNLRVMTANRLKDQEREQKGHGYVAGIVCLVLGGIGGYLIAIGWVLQYK